MPTTSRFVKEFLRFVDASPSPFHAVESCSQRLVSAGFQEILESDSWEGIIRPGGKYFFTRNKSAVLAFAVGEKYRQGNGFCILGAHTDSPCLKVKPRSNKEKFGYVQLGVELYGGGIWHSWFDRDLSVAGRVLVENESGAFEHRLVHVHRPLLRIPTLAIHLERGVNDNFSFNNEVQLTPVLAQVASDALNKTSEGKDAAPLHPPALLSILSSELKVPAEKIRDFELCLYDTQNASLGGANDEFIHTARLDNLMMSYCSLMALTESSTSLADEKYIRFVGLFDNEEVGSTTAHGANSNLLTTSLKRLSELPLGVASSASENDFIPNHDDNTNDADWVLIQSYQTQSRVYTQKRQEAPFERAMTHSLLVSADMAHALHPNYSEKHEENHRPKINGGVVIKQNANQRYATTSISTLILREAAKKSTPVVPLQEFVVRNDSPCGSTIGPMLSAKLGIKTIDVGNPQWSMHSIRETCGTKDVDYAISLFSALFQSYGEIVSRFPAGL